MSEVIKIACPQRSLHAAQFGAQSTGGTAVERLSDGAAGERRRIEKLPASGKLARREIAARQARRKFFSGELFADPAWDMLLELYASRCEQRRISTSKLAIAAGVPATTAARWMEKLERDCLLVRKQDPLDARRVWLDLSQGAVVAMDSYFRDVSPAALL